LEAILFLPGYYNRKKMIMPEIHEATKAAPDGGVPSTKKK
jgi:hypothetical protein